MRLLRVGEKGAEVPAVLDADGAMRDVSSIAADYQGEAASIAAFDAIAKADLSALPVIPEGTRIGAALADVPNFFCIGLNYAMHAAETNSKVPPEPLIFNKATSALCGPFDDLPRPKGSESLDWEVELGFVIGKTCHHVSEADALSYISAYFTANDVSEREFQKNRGGQFVKGKSGENFGPIGPYLVTPDEVADPQNLEVTTKVNGKVMQSSNTSDMIFSVAEIIANMSSYMILQPGDIVITGTPSGVAMGMHPPQWLQDGDVVEVSVGDLGAQKATVV